MPVTTAETMQASTGTLEWHSDLDAIRPEWQALAEQSGNVFMTWEWADAWRRHLGPHFPLVTALIRRSDGTPQGVLPLYYARRRPLGVLRFVGVGPSDELGPICAPADRIASAQVLHDHAGRLLGSGGVLLAERLGCRPSVASTLGGTVVQRSATPVVALAGQTYEAYLATRSANFRSQARRCERRLVRDHGLRYRLTTDPDELEGDLRELIRLHHRRWANGASDAFTGPREAFHLDFARRALENGWLRLWTVELDGRPAAAWYGLRFAGTDYYYQSGREPRYASLKLGFVLLCHTIRSACEDGMTEYRFGLGDEAYKSRFCTSDPGLETVAMTVGLRGRLGLGSLVGALWARERARGGGRVIGRMSKAGAASPSP